MYTEQELLKFDSLFSSGTCNFCYGKRLDPELFDDGCPACSVRDYLEGVHSLNGSDVAGTAMVRVMIEVPASSVECWKREAKYLTGKRSNWKRMFTERLIPPVGRIHDNRKPHEQQLETLCNMWRKLGYTVLLYEKSHFEATWARIKDMAMKFGLHADVGGWIWEQERSIEGWKAYEESHADGNGE